MPGICEGGKRGEELAPPAVGQGLYGRRHNGRVYRHCRKLDFDHSRRCERQRGYRCSIWWDQLLRQRNRTATSRASADATAPGSIAAATMRSFSPPAAPSTESMTYVFAIGPPPSPASLGI